MCAISGLADLKNPSRPVSIDLLKRMADAQFHRGPDEAGEFSAPGIGLAHRRLSLVGLDNGRQPLRNEDGSVVVVANGEFFDHASERRALEAKGHRFATSSDCEILVHLWEEHGTGMLERLRGQFAFALWDSRQRKLVLARDRFGIVPLHWAQADGKLVFSSEIKGILASGLVEPEADHKGLDHIFSFFAMPSRRTCFRGVSAILPGHYLEIDADTGAVDEHQYWEMDFPDRGDEYDPAGRTAPDEFGALLGEATERRLRADVPVGCYLSGGVDSTALLQLASRSRSDGRGVAAFTIEIPSPKLNEIAPARLAAEQVGAQQHSIVCGAETIGNAFPGLVRACEAPVMDTSSAALICLSGEVTSHSYKAVLSGEGADEALAGYPWFKGNRLLTLLDRGAFRPSNVVRRAIGKARGRQTPWHEIKRYQSLIGGTPALSDFYGLLRRGRRTFYSDHMWSEIDGHSPYADLKLDLERMKRWHPLNQSLYFGYKTILPGLLLNQKGDRPAMANSVEARYPFLDEKVVDYCCRLAPKWKLRGLLRDKRVLREFASDMLPKSITRRRKHIFRAPFASTFFAKPPQFVQQLVSPESLATTGYFDSGEVERQFRDYLDTKNSGRRDLVNEMALSTVMATQLWHHIYLGGGLCELPAWTPPEIGGRVSPREPAAAGPQLV